MRHRSADVVAIMIVTAVALALALLGLHNGIVALLLGVPLLFFLPGYALTVAATRTLSIPKRMLFSVALSLGWTELGRLLLPWTPWGTQISAWAGWLGSGTLAAALGALVRDGVREHVGVRDFPLAPPSVRSWAAYGAAGAVYVALVVARTGATAPASAAMLQRWLADGAPSAPAIPTSAVALPMTSAMPAPTAAAPAASTRSLAAALAASMPTQLPVPTGTPAPAHAPVPPTSTTQAVKLLDIALNQWPNRETATASMRFEGNHYRLTLNGQPSVSAASAISVNNYRLSVDVVPTQGEAGVVFLAVEPTRFYRIMFNTNGAYAIEQVQQHSPTTSLIKGWTTSAALQGAEHIRVQIERHGDTVQFSANNQPLTTFMVPQGRATNQVGVAVTAASQHGQATFASLAVEQLAAY